MSDCEIPQKLNKKLFEDALSNKFKKPVEVSEFEISMGSKKGDNYTSDIYRARVKFAVNGKSDEISLIAKYIKEDEGDARKMFNELNMISREIEMYDKILPRFTELLGEKCSADCYFILNDPTIFFFEDLKASGFQLAERLIGLDFNHCKVFLRKISKFHAASKILFQEDSKIFESFKYGIYREPSESETTYQFTKSAVNDVIEVVSKWEGFQEIVEKLKKIEGNLSELIFKNVNLTKSDFPVLNHGDTWTNNFMFKYQEGSNVPNDIALFDYQLPFFASFAIDYQYFMINSCSDEVLEKHEEECLEVYFESLVETLKKFGYSKIPTIKQLKEELRRFQFFGLITAISVMPVILMDKDKEYEYSVDEILNSGDFRKTMYNGKRCTKLLKYYLLKYDKSGALDVDV